MLKEKDIKRLSLLSKALRDEIESAEPFSDPFRKRISHDAISGLKDEKPITLFLTSRPAIAAGFVFMVVCLILSLPFIGNLTERKDTISLNARIVKKAEVYAPLKIDAKKIDGTIALSWEGSQKNVVKISRSSSPRDFSNAYSVTVAGNNWVDPLQNGSNIVFYKIE